jgi:hypothetical protein
LNVHAIAGLLTRWTMPMTKISAKPIAPTPRTARGERDNMTTTHSIKLTPQQLKDVTDLLRIEAGRLYECSGTEFVGKIYDDLYQDIQRQWTREQSRKRIASNLRHNNYRKREAAVRDGVITGVR